MASARRRALVGGALAAGLLGTTLAVFAPVRGFDFVAYDDFVYVADNPHLDQGLSPAGVRWAFRPHETNWIPLTWLSLLADAELHGRTPGGYHVTNLAIHAASVLLLFATLAAATGAPGRAAFVAGVFAWHPLHVESVAWISERKDVLAGLLWMATLAAWTRYARAPGIGRYALALAALALGLLAKPVAVTLPFALLLWDDWPLDRLRGPERRLDRARVRRAVLEKLPMLPLVAAASAVTWLVQREQGAMSSLGQLGLALRAQNALVAYVAYLRDAFWPAGLAVFYPHPAGALPAGRWLGAAGLLAALTAGALARARRQPWLAVGWLWFLGTLVPMIGLVQVGLQARADRYTYIPLVGLAIAVAWGAQALAARWPRALAALAAGVLAALALATSRQLEHWRDGRALFERAAAVTRDNYVALHGLAVIDLREGHPQRAAERFAEAVRLRPDWATARGDLADALLARGDVDDAIRTYQEAVELAPRDARLRADLGHACARAGRHAEAVAHYERARQLDDRSEPTRSARILALLAASWAALGDPERAASLDEQALALDPALAAARANRALARLAADPAGAEAELRRELADGADTPELHAGLAAALARLGREAEAAAEYRAALAARPGWAEPANNLAWLLATARDPAVRDPAEALRWAEAAARTSRRRDPNVLDTLATAQLASGLRRQARATLDEAIALARAKGDTAQIRALQASRARLAP